MDYAVEWSHQALFFNMGQVCTAGSRTYVQEDIYDEYVKKAVARAKAKTVGDPYDHQFESGPQVIAFVFVFIVVVVAIVCVSVSVVILPVFSKLVNPFPNKPWF